MQLTWGSFAKGKDGEWDGLNNAAIYSFNSDIINSLVREMFQNSIDARTKRLDKTGKRPRLIVKINYKEIEKNEFPDFDGFYKIFKLVSKAAPNKTHTKFFKNAFEAIDGKARIPLFIFEDYNTIGLKGEDHDSQKSFNACVVSEGLSIKSEATAGGSFGIGKNALYGLSKLRTVFYVSVNSDKEYIFQGKAKLASYYDENEKTRDYRIYCGLGTKKASVRNLNDLPARQRHIFTRTEPGLSQFAVCPVQHKDWADEFAKAILRNYWMLLNKDELEVELLEQDNCVYKLTFSNLEEMLLKFFDPENYVRDDVRPKGNPYEYFKCLQTGKCINTRLSDLGHVKFYYAELKNYDTNCVAYLRNDMVVYADQVHGFRSIGYCGVFLCEDQHGNEILRAMEPPTHDSFSSDLLGEKLVEFTSSDGKRILNEIKKSIRSALQEILDQYTRPSESIEWLNDFLTSLTGETGSGTGDRKNDPTDEETVERIGRNVSKTLEFDSQGRNTLVNDETGEVQGIGSGRGHNGGSKTGGKTNVGRGEGPFGVRESAKTKIQTRIFHTSRSGNIGGKSFGIYRLILQGDKEIPATDILITQHGDSGEVAFFQIGDVRSESGKKIHFTEEVNKNAEKTAYRLKGVSVPSILEVWVDEPYKSSFKIIKS